jgi:hypothetical protein
MYIRGATQRNEVLRPVTQPKTYAHGVGHMPFQCTLVRVSTENADRCSIIRSVVSTK